MKQNPTSPIQCKTTTPRFLIAIALVLSCVASLSAPNAFGVVPAPDGGYPGFNTAEGQNALFGLTTGIANTAVGWYSLFSNTEGSSNTATGAGALLFNTADENTAFGTAALLSNTTGIQNTANGALALLNNTTGGGNTATGAFALYSNTEGRANTATGTNALVQSTGSDNTANGIGALASVTTGNLNTALGYSAGNFVTTATDVICIGAEVYGANVSGTCFIGNIRGVTTINNNAVPVVIDGAGQLGTVSSSRRFKNEIKPMDQASEAILGLKPVTFHYKSDSTGTPQFGLIAEEVEKVNPDLVVRDDKGDIYTVRYDAVNAMLLNEFLKEHRKVEEQQSKIEKQEETITELKSTVAQHQKGMEVLTAQLKDQASHIQKVSAQLAAASPPLGGLELIRFATGRIRRGGPAPRVVLNNQ